VDRLAILTKNLKGFEEETITFNCRNSGLNVVRVDYVVNHGLEGSAIEHDFTTLF
jgi:hypothetical protein